MLTLWRWWRMVAPYGQAVGWNPKGGLSCLRCRQVIESQEASTRFWPSMMDSAWWDRYCWKVHHDKDQETLEFGAFIQRGENVVGGLFALFLTSKDHLEMPKNNWPSTKASGVYPAASQGLLIDFLRSLNSLCDDALSLPLIFHLEFARLPLILLTEHQHIFFLDYFSHLFSKMDFRVFS